MPAYRLAILRRYAFVCKLLDMNPFRGLNFVAFTRVYLDDGLPFEADVHEDHAKIFGGGSGGGGSVGAATAAAAAASAAASAAAAAAATAETAAADAAAAAAVVQPIDDLE